MRIYPKVKPATEVEIIEEKIEDTVVEEKIEEEIPVVIKKAKKKNTLLEVEVED